MAKDRPHIDINLNEAEENRDNVVEYMDDKEHGCDDHIFGVRLKGAYFLCTSCGRLRPASKFGLRMTEDGFVRNQAQCSSCR